MLDATSDSRTGKQARSLQTFAEGQIIHVSAHASRIKPSGRVTACAAPFLSCKNSIMEGEDGVARCNSPFLFCTRYVFAGELRDGLPDGTLSTRGVRNAA